MSTRRASRTRRREHGTASARHGLAVKLRGLQRRQRVLGSVWGQERGWWVHSGPWAIGSGRLAHSHSSPRRSSWSVGG